MHPVLNLNQNLRKLDGILHKMLNRMIVTVIHNLEIQIFMVKKIKVGEVDLQ